MTIINVQPHSIIVYHANQYCKYQFQPSCDQFLFVEKKYGLNGKASSGNYILGR